MAANMYGFEVLVGPYAVAHLRLTQAIEGAGGALPAEKRLKVFLADTLESPNASPPGGLTLTYKALTQEHEAARKIKKGGEILVCLGNPPYDRQQIEQEDTSTHRKGGWVRFGDQIKGGAKQEKQGERPILTDFTDPASKAGAGVHLKNLYNDYVYFWRWALWRLFEQQNGGGIVTFITASSYLAGPGFVGMREVMRKTFDELWIIDLGGDNLGTRKTPNVFNIQTPVAIAIGIRGPKKSSKISAKGHYAKVTGDTREEKLAQLTAVAQLTDLTWADCSTEWQKPLLPIGQGDFFEWPLITDVFPWAHSGAQFKRSWPIGETECVLIARWKELSKSSLGARKALFRETNGWRISKKVNIDLPGKGEPSISEIGPQTAPPKIYRYVFRQFDRQYAFYDYRLGDRLRPDLFAVLGDKQVYLMSLLTKVIGVGPAIGASAHLPDLDIFCGRGGKDIIPLYRDLEGTQPNITAGLLKFLGDRFGSLVSAEELAAYVYAVLGCQAYTSRFWNELETPGPRIPITKNSELFQKAAKLGRKLIWLHTYGERFLPSKSEMEIPSGAAKAIQGISNDPAKYPEMFKYDPIAKEIHVGEGRFGPVPPQVWNFEISGLKVVQSWLAYRMKARAGKKSSPLDDIRPSRWIPRMTDELLELLWVLEATLAMEPELSSTLDAIVKDQCFAASKLPLPAETERQPPKDKLAEGDLIAIMEGAPFEEDEEIDDV